MYKRNFKADRLEITEFAFNKIISWAQALDETVWLCVGLDKKIVDAVRLTNISSAPRNYFDYKKSEVLQVKEKIELSGFEVICMGHSHPNKLHLRHPSRSDWKHLPKGSIQMICFPIEKNLKVWRFSTCYKKTLRQEYMVDICRERQI